MRVNCCCRRKWWQKMRDDDGVGKISRSKGDRPTSPAGDILPTHPAKQTPELPKIKEGNWLPETSLVKSAIASPIQKLQTDLQQRYKSKAKERDSYSIDGNQGPKVNGSGSAADAARQLMSIGLVTLKCFCNQTSVKKKRRRSQMPKVIFGRPASTQLMAQSTPNLLAGWKKICAKCLV